jgi:DNA-binding beta-propeller fold protein YncE
MTRSVAGLVVLGLSVAFSIAGALAQNPPVRYEADVTWPKPLPNQWVLGGLGGVCVDAQDHVFILNRQDVADGDLNAARLAPQIIEFDSAGSVVNAWGDPAQLDPRLHSCHVDNDTHIWIASSPSGMVQKYTHDGRALLLQIGKKGTLDSSDGTVKGTPLNSSAAVFFMPSSIAVDPQSGEVYVADGESSGGNRRVAVLDAKGAFLRHWRPDVADTVHCLAMARDRRIYVCDRTGSRILVYDTAGHLQRTIAVPWTPVTPPSDGKRVETGGSAVAIAFSPDQRLLFVINQNNARVDILERETGSVVGGFGRAGTFPGEFNQPHGIAVDSRGNVYVAENRGRRVHKFKPRT